MLDIARGGGEREDARSLHHDRYTARSSELLDVQRRAILRLRDEGRINDDVLRQIERDLDLQAVRLQ
jgi:CPA1 family monovalent cation:H+ antiporter